MNQQVDLEIKQTYDWCVRAFSILRKRLGINIRFHHNEGQIEAGQIFLFNHFARFETIIPQYLIYQATGAYCRCVAASELFEGKDSVTRFLLSLGAVPNNLPGLLPFLAAETLRGRKVIVFPEGGMVKDRRVIDDKGHYSIFSRTSLERRKHHRGAAVIALLLEVFKIRILSLEASGDEARIERWRKALGLESAAALLAAARQPAQVVPANITFYPIRISDNILRKGMEFFNQDLSAQFMEELLIEGNILLKHTDMDIQLGTALSPLPRWRWWDKRMVDRLFLSIDSLDDLFELNRDSSRWVERVVSLYLTRATNRLRDAYMREMYAAVTLNASHLASDILLEHLDGGATTISHDLFDKTLYLAIKNLQTSTSVNLHRSLRNPESYQDTLTGDSPHLAQFITSAVESDLIERQEDGYRLRSKLQAEHAFDEVRLENLVSVYANEMAPIADARRAVQKAMKSAPKADAKVLASLRFDDEVRAFDWCRWYYSKPRYHEINAEETATENGAPYLLRPKKPKPLGVLLVHGFLASPAELRSFAGRLEALGHPVLGVRLAGHGTSPWDLRDRAWEDWLASVARGQEILSAQAERLAIVGFSAGGALALIQAAAQPSGLAGVVSVSAPLKFRNRNMMFVPLVHGANWLAQWVPSLEGVMPFRKNESEHPHINYSNMPVRGLYELRRLASELERRLPQVSCPVRLIQASDDHVVDPKSASLILDKLGAGEKDLIAIDTARHGILNEDIDGTQERVIEFLAGLDAG